MWGAKEFTRGTKKIFARFVRRTKRTERICSTQLELKTEKGYSADIVRTYIPGDICPHNVRTISFFGFQLRFCYISIPGSATSVTRLPGSLSPVYHYQLTWLYFSSLPLQVYLAPFLQFNLALSIQFYLLTWPCFPVLPVYSVSPILPIYSVSLTLPGYLTPFLKFTIIRIPGSVSLV